MIVKLRELTNENKSNFSYEEVYFDDEIECVYPAKINAKIEKIENKYYITGEYEATLKLCCVRCLSELVPTIKGKFQAIYLDAKDYYNYMNRLNEIEELSEEDYIDEAVNNEIDISSLVREYILLKLSEYNRCIPKCNNEEEIEKYSKLEIDSRWQQLLEIEL